MGALTFGAGEKFVNPAVNEFVASNLMDRISLPTGSATRISTLVGSLFDDSGVHPRAFYQETTGLIEAGINAGEGVGSQWLGLP